ncbi:MAG TPA: ribosome-associated translation inhibitor RaiA [Baekduia sp.]|uniref:ribosome hibernation-promoting factor, HPF/YfiA family n=1 Tax=Baekduia sp. TaxID=2600305 RepID=UPI002D794609|nr:ribosome-associated translation inhibitor RaiA [Baekduia sp.]HET6506725.1 ribosome-associated translation inhibitor RaiA [Baekduia sp.]
MQIEVKGRHMTISDEIREQVEKRFAKVGKQVSELATLEVELSREPNAPDCYRAEVTLRVKGTTLRACDKSRDMAHSINLVSEELAVQVKRHRDKRRKRRESRAAAMQQPGMAPGGAGGISAAM